MDLAGVFISLFEICPNLLEVSNCLVLQSFLPFIFLEDKLSLYSDQENVSTNKSSYIHINLVSCLKLPFFKSPCAGDWGNKSFEG